VEAILTSYFLKPSKREEIAIAAKVERIEDKV
jgi:hypothetical protein